MHYTVLVLGPEPDEQMQGFCESLDDVIKREKELFNERKKLDPNASAEPVLLQRIDVLADRRQEFEEDVAAGKNEVDTLEAYIDHYYYGEIQWLPKSIYLSKPEIYTREQQVSIMRRNLNEPPMTEWEWSLQYDRRFAVIGSNGEVEMVITYAVAQPKWDWYTLGGRWANFYKVLPDHMTAVMYECPANREAQKEREADRLRFPSLFGRKEEVDPRMERTGYADQLHRRDLDVEGMRAHAREEGAKYYDKFHEVVAGRPFYTYDEWLQTAGGDREKAREMRDADPADSAIRASDYMWLDQDELIAMRLPRDEYIKKWERRCFSTYSVLDHGVWRDKREWFDHGRRRLAEGVNYGYKDLPEGEWDNYINTLIETMSPDTLMTMYDYHS